MNGSLNRRPLMFGMTATLAALSLATTTVDLHPPRVQLSLSHSPRKRHIPWSGMPDPGRFNDAKGAKGITAAEQKRRSLKRRNRARHKRHLNRRARR